MHKITLIQEENFFYVKCTLSYKLTKELDSQIESKMSEIEALCNQIQHPSRKVDDIESQVASIHSDIRALELQKEQIVKRTSNFRESIALKLPFIEKQLEECVKAKDKYTNFLYSDINAVKIESYALCAILISDESSKVILTKGMEILKTIFDDWMKIILA